VVRLFLVSQPHASVEVTWEGGSQRVETPRTIDVPKGARVKLVFAAPGYEKDIRELTADAQQPVMVTLARRK
jgi:hypothetical protein